MDEVTEDDCEMLRQHFMTLDNGNKGYLNEADLAILVPPGDQQQDAVLQLMKHLDADKDGRVSDNIRRIYYPVLIMQWTVL